MKYKFFPSILLFSTFMLVNILGQQMPLVYEVENTGADCPKPYLPTFSELPTITSLPDPFEWSDGRGQMSNFSDWRYRRAEIKAEIENYEIGEKPVRPDSIEANYSNGTLTINITKNGKTLTLTSNVILPSGDGPFPAVIGMNTPSGSIPSTIFSSRKIAQITFSHNQITTYSNPQNSDPYYRLYPDLNIDNTGQYSAWAWGVSRIIDGLELVQDVLPIDIKHIAVTGCSYAGKLALFAGALDERIALTIAQESGGGGYTAWRVSETLGNVETLGKTDRNWFKEDMFDFSNAVTKLLHDHHELMAMVAPRALLVTGNPDYEWLADESGYVASKATKEVYNALGISDRFGFSIVDGHMHCAVPNSQVPEIEAFVDKFLLGEENVDTEISTTPFNSNLSPWIKFTTPTLSNDSSFFGKTGLVSPPNLQKEVDTTVTFQWNKSKDTVTYSFQLATNSTFTKIVESDSGLSDTVKSVDGLIKGKVYYWRVQIINSLGESGPWSNQFNFSTATPLPMKPELVSAIPYPNRPDYVKFTWNEVGYADKYIVQLSEEKDFTDILAADSTSNTVKVLSGTSEGGEYYWRVQAKNIAGAGPWSDVENLTVILPPTNLKIETNEQNEIVLTWNDNSSVEDGYVIERIQSPDTSFTVHDSLFGSVNNYIDQNFDPGQHTYTYRVNAFKDSRSSEYSNEVSIMITGINEEKGIPKEYFVSQNYPNPFNPSTKIEFGLPKRSMTKIAVYDILGRELQVLVNRELDAGYHEINFDANTSLTGFSSGIYFYRISSGDFNITRKMILMK